MNNMELATTGTPLASAPIAACVLFDANGEIRHRHEVLNFPGSTPEADHEIESDARRLAAQLGHDVSALEALHVAPENYRTEKHYAVDTQSLRLVEIPPASVKPHP